jgi:hypothetical protein
MNKETLIKQFGEAITEMRRTHDNGTYHWNLEVDDNNNQWAIVLGWQDGYEEEPEDDCTDGTWRLCAKLAYQPTNSIMQCDYDIDWLMPYDEETGEVDDNEIPIYPNTDLKEAINWLLDCYHDYNY